MGQLVDQDQRGPARERGVEVELAQRGAAVLDEPGRQDLQPERGAPPSRRGRAARPSRRRRPRPSARCGAGGLEHGVGLADAGGGAEEDLQLARAAARASSLLDAGQERRRDRARVASAMAISLIAGGPSAFAPAQRRAVEGEVQRSTLTARLAEERRTGGPRCAVSTRLAHRGLVRSRARWRRGATWYWAAAGLMCGSSPLPDAVTRSTGTGRRRCPGRRRAGRRPRPRTASCKAGFVGPEVRAGRTRRRCRRRRGGRRAAPEVLRVVEGLADQLEPTALPSLTIRLPLAWSGKATWAIPVTSSRVGDAGESGETGAARRAAAVRIDVLRPAWLPAPSRQSQGDQDRSMSLMPTNGHDDPAQRRRQQVVAQQRRPRRSAGTSRRAAPAGSGRR